MANRIAESAIGVVPRHTRARLTVAAATVQEDRTGRCLPARLKDVHPEESSE
uniref:Transposase n=1 Tax=Streptomyces sp. NBC_00003 TaxID=2903608 RepID=A0AAU2UWE0_9ACTN